MLTRDEMLKKVIEIQAAKFENSNLKVSCFKKR